VQSFQEARAAFKTPYEAWNGTENAAPVELMDGEASSLKPPLPVWEPRCSRAAGGASLISSARRILQPTLFGPNWGDGWSRPPGLLGL